MIPCLAQQHAVKMETPILEVIMAVFRIRFEVVVACLHSLYQSAARRCFSSTGLTSTNNFPGRR